jgi:hypothetical protein
LPRPPCGGGQPGTAGRPHQGCQGAGAGSGTGCSPPVSAPSARTTLPG